MTGTLVPPATGKGTPATPFVGLVPYGEGDAAFFFGRDEEKAIISANLRASRLTILYGASGVGKTSVLHAGVVHDLRDRMRQTALGRTEDAPLAVCTFSRWRDHPLAALAEAMRAACSEALGGEELPSWRPGEPLLKAVRRWTKRVRRLLVVLDQFEEYFLYHAGEEGKRTFAAEFPRLVNEPNLRVNFILSLREDAWAKLDRFEESIPALFGNYVRVAHLDRKAAREAIDGPVREWNRRLPAGQEPYEVEPSLATKVIDAAAAGTLALTESGNGEGPDAAATGGVEAPFLQLVLERLWRATVEAGAHTLDLGRLESLGGAQQIVENHLLEALGKLTAGEQGAAAEVFRYLVTRSKTKIAHPATDLADWTGRPEAEVTAVLEKLCRGESGRILRSVSPPAGETAVSYELFHDILAEPILAWRKGYEQRREHEAEALRQRARRRRLQRLVAVLVLIAVVLAVFGGWALYERGVANGQRQRAESQAMAAESLRDLDSRVDDAMMLALGAYEHAHTIEARGALVSAAQRASGLVRLLRFAHPITSVDTGPGGAIAVAFSDGDVVILDRRARPPGREVPISENSVDAVAFDPSRPRLVAASADRVELLGLRRNPKGRLEPKPEPLGEDNLSGGQVTVRSIAFSRDGRWLAAGGVGGVTLWRVEPTGHLDPVRLPGSGANVAALAFTGAQPLLAATSARGLRVWNLGLAHPTPRLVDSGRAGALAVGPDGGAAAINGRARLWHGLPGAPTRLGPGGQPTALAFDSRATMLASGHVDGSVELWDVRRGEPLGPRLRAQGGEIVSVAFEAGSSLLAVASADHTVTLWDTRARARLVRDLDLGKDLTGAAFGRNGSLAVLTRGSVLKVGNLDAASPTRVAARRVRTVAASTDGRRLLVIDNRMSFLASLDTRAVRRVNVPVDAQYPKISHTGVIAAVVGLDFLRVWDDGGLLPTTLVPPKDLTGARAVAVSADGRSVAAGYWDNGTIVLWQRIPGGWPTGVVLGGPAKGQRPVGIWELAFDPGGDVLASGDDDGTITLWRVGKRPVAIPGHEGRVTSLAFAPVGGMLASAGVDGVVRLWDQGRGKALGDPISLGGRVDAVTFSPDGRWLLALHGGRLTVWDTTLWQPGSKTFARVREQFCASLWSQIPAAAAAACDRNG